MRLPRSNKWIAAGFGIAVLGSLGAAVAIASPGSGVTSTLIVPLANFDHTVHWNSDRVKFQTKEATDVRVQKLEFAPGSFSGWHHHPGVVMVIVESGAVTLWDSNCQGVTYGPGLPNGAVFVEGGDEPIQATSTTGATNYVVYVVPDGDVFRVEDEPPSCAL